MKKKNEKQENYQKQKQYYSMEEYVAAKAKESFKRPPYGYKRYERVQKTI